MDFTVKEISEAMQLTMPQARAVVKVCKLYEKARKHEKYSYQVWLDKICNTFGIEEIFEVSPQYPDSDEIGFEYLNTGDTYQSTIIFDEGKTYISSWGDTLEAKERELYEELDQPRACICQACNHHCFYADQGADHRLEALRGELRCPNCGDKLHYVRRY